MVGICLILGPEGAKCLNPKAKSCTWFWHPTICFNWLRTPNLKNPKDPKGCTFLAEHLTHSSQKVGIPVVARRWGPQGVDKLNKCEPWKTTIYMIYEICGWNFNFTSWQKLWWKCPRGKPAGEYILIDAPLAIKWRNTFYCTETAFCWTESRIAFCKVQR